MAAFLERNRHSCIRCPSAAEVCRLPFYSTLLTVAVHAEIIGCKLQELKGRYSSYLVMLLGGWQHCLRRSGVENKNHPFQPNSSGQCSRAGDVMSPRIVGLLK